MAPLRCLGIGGASKGKERSLRKKKGKEGIRNVGRETVKIRREGGREGRKRGENMLGRGQLGW